MAVISSQAFLALLQADVKLRDEVSAALGTARLGAVVGQCSRRLQQVKPQLVFNHVNGWHATVLIDHGALQLTGAVRHALVGCHAAAQPQSACPLCPLLESTTYRPCSAALAARHVAFAKIGTAADRNFRARSTVARMHRTSPAPLTGATHPQHVLRSVLSSPVLRCVLRSSSFILSSPSQFSTINQSCHSQALGAYLLLKTNPISPTLLDHRSGRNSKRS
jgi:hypothetical protein